MNERQQSDREPKRRRLNETYRNPFLDLEADVDEEEEDEDEEYDSVNEIMNEDEMYADSVTSHLNLYNTMAVAEEDNEEAWARLLRRARKAGRRDDDGEAGGTMGSTDILWEIGCAVGSEESMAFLLLQAYDEPTKSSPRAVIAQPAFPGRIYVEVDTIDQAQTISRTITGLRGGAVRRVPDEERRIILGGPLSSTRTRWSKVRGRRRAWGSYRGDTGLVHTPRGHSKQSILLIPRVPSSEEGGSPVRELQSWAHLVAVHGRNRVGACSNGHFKFRGKTYNEDGFLVVDLDKIDTLRHTPTLPTPFELALFRQSSLVSRELWQETSIALSAAALKPGDRVKIIAGDYLGMNGIVTEVLEHEVAVEILGQDVNEHLIFSAVRKDFRVGDMVRVVGGAEAGPIGWVVEVYRDTLTLSDTENEAQVGAKFGEVEFYLPHVLASVPRRRRKTRLGPPDPHSVYHGKHVVVVGAHTFKGYRGIIKQTSVDGQAWVELEACQQKVVQTSLGDLSIIAKEIPTLFCVPPPIPAPTTLPPPPMDMLVVRPPHWLEDPCLSNIRVKLRVRGETDILEFVAVEGDKVRVREGMTAKLVALGSVEGLLPSAKGNLVTTLDGDMKGCILKVREIHGDRCEANIPGKKLRRNEAYPTFPLSTLFQVFPAFH